MFFSRDITKALQKFTKFPVVALIGPRQSGKTTLVKQVFKKHTFVTLEDPSVREFALSDPKGFLQHYENEHGLAIDEFQYAPQLLSYIQIEVDTKKRPGYFILTGSQNFLINQAITQTLAGRVGILTLLPFSLHELIQNKQTPTNSNDTLFTGFYPRIYTEKISPEDFYPSYIHTYAERDVRQLANVGNLRTFQTFMRLCAGRIGQLLNINELATTCGIARTTAEQWLSLLEASYIVFLLKPYFKNYNKRVTKSPKIYFYDTGLASSLLSIRSAKNLALNPYRGHLFENMIISDLYKQYYNIGITPPIYFWRDSNGRIEVDVILDLGATQIPIEIKSGATIQNTYFKTITQWSTLAQSPQENNYVIYAGDQTQKRTSGNLIGWSDTNTLIEKIENKA